MQSLKEYEIEFIKLKLGDHQFEYHLDADFFKAFNSSLSTNDVTVKLLFHKSETMFTLTFDFWGKLTTECDRCLSELELPVSGKSTLLVKITEYPLENEDDMIYISSSDYKLNVAQHIYDYVSLSVPIKKTCEDVGKKCDETVTAKITSMIDVEMGDRLPDRDTDDTEEEEEEF